MTPANERPNWNSYDAATQRAERIEAINEQIEELKRKVNSHSDDTGWSGVGDLGHVYAELTDINEFYQK